jgi:malonyl-CoA O-methyltransferase
VTDESDTYRVDAAFARRAFNRASRSYDAAAVLQGEVRGLLLERLRLTVLEPRLILDAGAGTGIGSRELKRRYPNARVLALDSAERMLSAAAARGSWLRPLSRVCADAARLPLADASVDLIFSNFLLPWSDTDRLLAEFRRVLAPHGLLTFSTLGPDTLRELRGAWASVDPNPRVHAFIDMHDLGDALLRSGFAEPVLDVERYTLEYPDVPRLAADLKALGEVNALAGRSRGLTGPRKFAAMRSAYEAHRRDGRLPATYEVIFGQAWSPSESRGRAGPPNTVSLEDMRRQLGSKRGRR